MKLTIALLFVSLVSAAQAKTLLEVKITSLRPGISGNRTGLNVTDKGDVTYYLTSVEVPSTNRLIPVAKLSQGELRTLKAQIKEADQPDTKTEVSFCAAVPSVETTYTANQGKIFLEKQATPCGNRVYNTSAAAQSLVTQLKAYVQEGRQLLRVH